MNSKNMFLRISIPALIFVFAFLLINRITPGLSFSNLSFFRSEKISTYTIAEEVRDLYVLNTTEYRMKLIFPFDFIEKDYNWWAIKEIYENDIEIPEDKIKNYNIYQTCINSGFDPAIDLYKFIVLTVVVKAGINISGTVYENLSIINESFSEKPIKIIERGDGKKDISLYFPDIEITEYYVEDRIPENDNFPDASLTPGQWKNLLVFLAPLIKEEVLELGILENARVNSELLIERILKDSGFVDVKFVGKDL